MSNMVNLQLNSILYHTIKAWALIGLLVLSHAPLMANNSEYPALTSAFDRNQLVNTNNFLMDPNFFNMQQSYSMSYWSSSNGSSSSQGLYLNHMTMNLAQNLVAFVDVGYHTPFHSNFQTQDPRLNAYGNNQNSSLIFPRFGLEYQPSENVYMSVQFVNGQDAMRAYGDPFMGGSMMGGSLMNSPWNRWDRSRINQR